jgi:lycopene beta-cyclase
MYDYIFCGGGLSTLLLLHEMNDQLIDKKTLVIDNDEYKNNPYLSYWSDEPTIFDEFRIASWNKVQCSGRRPDSTDPYTIGLLKKEELLNSIRKTLDNFPITWSSAKVQQIKSSEKTCKVYTDAGVEKAKLVFDSCVDIRPLFPDPKESIVLSGYELLVESDSEVFDDNTAKFYIQLPKTGTFGYMLPLSKKIALLESASFQPRLDNNDRKMLLQYLVKTYPKARFRLTHEQLGMIPLGFPPPRLSGSRHILIGQKRGLVKISAGYGIMSILRESKRIAAILADGKIPKPVRIQDRRYQIMDRYFLKLVRDNPNKADRIIRRSLQKQSITTNFALIDETLQTTKLAYTMIKSLPFLF